MSDVPPLSDLLAVAVDAARAAGRHTLTYFGGPLDVRYKGDASPVTRADTESEAILRREIARRFPHHAVLGEEGGETAGSTARVRWVIDPLDGTKSFVRGVPLYGVLVGVEIDGRPTVRARGLRWLNNDAVNFIASLLAVLFAWLLLRYAAGPFR